ncbi:myosin heavy chain isoform X2 [Drosophila teissieri]|uniref:myosin heavy chain isoform X2 n=1 Tax=Drosophila teissieri TaxID=7243 RepID=UPI001CBA1F3D|nr:myosin heavy chain isoform X2 [Drosophila teissieri]
MDRQGAYSSSWPIAEESEDQQRMMVSTPQLCNHRKTVASLKVFTMVMLHSWRQRRKEVRELQEKVHRLQDNSMKTKNQLHVYGTLVRVEEKRNRELQIKLKQSTMSIDQVKSSCESLVNSVRDLTTEKIRLQTDLDQRSQEYDELQKMSDKTKRLLSTAYMEQSYLQKQLISEQRIRRKLQEEKEQLIQEVVLAESRDAKYRQVREWYQHKLDEKKECIHILRRRMVLLEEKLRDIKENSNDFTT